MKIFVNPETGKNSVLASIDIQTTRRLADLTDVDLTNVANGSILVFNSTLGKFVAYDTYIIDTIINDTF